MKTKKMWMCPDSGCTTPKKQFDDAVPVLVVPLDADSVREAGLAVARSMNEYHASGNINCILAAIGITEPRRKTTMKPKNPKLSIAAAKRELSSSLFMLRDHFHVTWTAASFRALNFLVKKARITPRPARRTGKGRNSCKQNRSPGLIV